MKWETIDVDDKWKNIDVDDEMGKCFRVIEPLEAIPHTSISRLCDKSVHREITVCIQEQKLACGDLTDQSDISQHGDRSEHVEL